MGPVLGKITISTGDQDCIFTFMNCKHYIVIQFVWIINCKEKSKISQKPQPLRYLLKANTKLNTVTIFIQKMEEATGTEELSWSKIN